MLSTYSINALNCAIITTYKLLSYILVSLLNPKPKVITTIDSVVTSTYLGSILFNFFYYNYSSDYIMEPYSSCYGRFINRLGI